MHIGVFDSGIGGEAVAEALRLAFSESTVTVVNDHKHVPYGSRQAKEIIQLTNTALQPLLVAQCDVIVIACNTATAAAIEWLRETYPNQKFIGLEPMVKPAAKQTKSGIIAVCATPATLASERYQHLKERYGADITILEPDCSQWAYKIEHNELNEEDVRSTIEYVIDQNADVIVLACTHYHWIHELIQIIARERATVIDPTPAIVQRIESFLSPSAAQTP